MGFGTSRRRASGPHSRAEREAPLLPLTEPAQPSRLPEPMPLHRRSWLLRIGCALLLLAAAFRLGAADGSPTPAPGTAATHRFLVLADFHFDPFLGLSRDQFALLAAAPLADWPQLLSAQPAPQYGSDSPFPLVQSSLEDARSRLADPDFLLIPGDFLAHGWSAKYDQLAAQTRSQNPAAYRAFTRQVIQFLAERLRQAFPRTPIFPVLGNDDSDCGDYLIGPDSPFLEQFAEVWSPLMEAPGAGAGPGSPEVISTLRRGGYYSIRLPRLANHRLIALNTVFCAPQYSNACGDPTATPALDQFRWFEAALAAAERQGEQVWLLMHIPPGMDSFATQKASGQAQPLWQPELTAWFLQLVKRHEGILQLAIAGHTHMDDFRVVQLGGRPALLTKIAPAVSPIFGNNPGYQIFHYERATGDVRDYLTYGLPLNSPAGNTPAWRVEYEFSRTYGSLQFNASSMVQLGADIISGAPARATFRQFYTVSGPPTPVSDLILGCAIRNTTVAGFTDCAAGTK